MIHRHPSVITSWCCYLLTCKVNNFFVCVAFLLEMYFQYIRIIHEKIEIAVIFTCEMPCAFGYLESHVFLTHTSILKFYVEAFALCVPAAVSTFARINHTMNDNQIHDHGYIYVNKHAQGLKCPSNGIMLCTYRAHILFMHIWKHL